MRRFILDTNVVVAYIRKAPLYERIEHEQQLTDKNTLVFLSAVTVAELLSLARQLSWGEDKVRELNHYLAKNLILDIKGTDKELMAAYAEIDAYSQGKLKDKPLHGSAKNMGKNDLWIAATAKVAKAKLITTDNDFHHLNGTMIDVLTYKPN